MQRSPEGEGGEALEPTRLQAAEQAQDRSLGVAL